MRRNSYLLLFILFISCSWNPKIFHPGLGNAGQRVSKQGQVELVEHMNGGVLIRGRIPGRALARFESYIREQDEK